MLLSWLLPIELLALAATAAAYNHVVIFGASYCDDGASKLTNPPYDGGRWTNGLTFGEYLSDSIGASLNDYAIGGSIVDDDYGQSGPSSAQQVQLYLSQLSSSTVSYQPDDKVLHIFWIGLNTLKQVIWPPLLAANSASRLLANAKQQAASSSQGVLSQATAIQDAFETQKATADILILSLPPTQNLPSVAQGGFASATKLQYLDSLTQIYNQGLYNGTIASGNTSSTFMFFDAHNWWNGLSNGTVLALPNVTKPCITEPNDDLCAPCNEGLGVVEVCSNPSDFLYWDAVHPTYATSAAKKFANRNRTVVHAALAKQLQSEFVTSANWSTMMPANKLTLPTSTADGQVSAADRHSFPLVAVFLLFGLSLSLAT